MDMDRMHQAVKELIALKDEKKKYNLLTTKYFKIYKNHLGKTQAIGRTITKKLNELDEFKE